MFYERLKNACKAKGTTPSVVTKEVGITTANTGRWKHGGMPSVEVLLKFAERLETSTDYLLGRTDTKSPMDIPGKKKEPQIWLIHNKGDGVDMGMTSFMRRLDDKVKEKLEGYLLHVQNCFAKVYQDMGGDALLDKEDELLEDYKNRILLSEQKPPVFVDSFLDIFDSGINYIRTVKEWSEGVFDILPEPRVLYGFATICERKKLLNEIEACEFSWVVTSYCRELEKAINKATTLTGQEEKLVNQCRKLNELGMERLEEQVDYLTKDEKYALSQHGTNGKLDSVAS